MLLSLQWVCYCRSSFVLKANFLGSAFLHLSPSTTLGCSMKAFTKCGCHALELPSLWYCELNKLIFFINYSIKLFYSKREWTKTWDRHSVGLLNYLCNYRELVNQFQLRGNRKFRNRKPREKWHWTVTPIASG